MLNYDKNRDDKREEFSIFASEKVQKCADPIALLSSSVSPRASKIGSVFDLLSPLKRLLVPDHIISIDVKNDDKKETFIARLCVDFDRSASLIKILIISETKNIFYRDDDVCITSLKVVSSVFVSRMSCFS